MQLQAGRRNVVLRTRRDVEQMIDAMPASERAQVPPERVLMKSGFRYAGEVVDPEDGTVSRFEKAVSAATTVE